jgi:SAM-dependent methyltransferase
MPIPRSEQDVRPPMSSVQNTVQWYDEHAAELAPRYEGMHPDVVHEWIIPLLPEAPGLVIDIGAGTGRDAAWFVSKGFEVVAVEPSFGMRAEAERLHPDPKIKWMADRLPSLSMTLRLGIAADVVFLGAVWMHLPADDRPRAFRKLVSLTKSGGLIAISIRNGPPDNVRGFHAASVDEVERLARGHGLAVMHVSHAKDLSRRDDVSWDYVALRLPDDGTNALPLLRHIVLNEDKTTSYKLGLLRSLCRAADGSAGMARESGDDHVAVPLGLVALTWLRLYLPLLAADLPQSPINRTRGESLGFAKDGTAAILEGDVPLIDLRIGTRFSENDANLIHSALSITTRTILKNPATFTTYPKGGRIFLDEGGVKRVATGAGVTLDASYLESFGWLLVPRDVWRALQRFGAWIEPSIIAEWIRLMKGYAASQGRPIDDGRIAAAMTWSNPDRDVAVPRGIALKMLDRDKPIHCVWSGKRLDASTLDIDHCFPWSAWSCGDLWNLMPADRRINRHKKRDKLPSDRLLLEVRDNVLGWWETAYLSPPMNEPEPLDDATLKDWVALPARFRSEARASLPALAGDGGELEPDDIHGAMLLHRLRLSRDQQVPEWDGL